MEKNGARTMAYLLRIAVWGILAVNIVALLFVPLLAPMLGRLNSKEEVQAVLDNLTKSGLPAVWREAITTPETLFPTVGMFFCFILTAAILVQALRVIRTILAEQPFSRDNAANMLRAGLCCFGISGIALLRLSWDLVATGSWASLISYNTLFVPLFLIAGLLMLVMSALFRQAAELKEENDLTI